MASIEDEAIDVMLEARLAISAKAISYERGAVAISLDAIHGQTDWDEVNSDGMTTLATKSHDWIFYAADVVSLLPPAAADVIRWTTDDGAVLLFSVMSNGGEQPWRYADRNRKWIRVHTTQTGTA